MRIKHFFLALSVMFALNSSYATVEEALKAYNNHDWPTALKEIQQPVQQADPEAEFILGRMYYYGEGVPKDFAKANQFMLASAKQNYFKAQSFLGIMYMQQNDPNYQHQALSWLLKAGNNGDIIAQMILG